MASLIHPGRSVLVYLLLGIVVLASAQLAFFLIGCQQFNRLPEERVHQEDLYTREQFQRLIMDKTEEEVLQAIGRPRTTSQEKNVRYWHYANRTMDPLTKEPDTDAQVVFENGRVRAINY